MKIVNLGSLNVDHVYRVDQFIVAGETKACQSLAENAGGKGLNQSVAAARTGVEVYHAGFVGQGSAILTDALTRGGVRLDLLETKDIPNGHAIIQVDDNGQNCIIIYGGTNQCLTEEYIDRVLGQLTGDDMLLLQNETNLVPYAIEAAHARGIPVAMNVAPMDEKAKRYPLGKLRWLVVNEIEGAALAGGSTFEETMDNLIAAYPETGIVLTLGSEGAWFHDGDRDIRMGCAKVPKVVDTTAAGDTFLGYFLAGMLNQLDPAEALRRATFASALTIQSPGAADSIPNAAQVDAVIASGALGELACTDSADAVKDAKGAKDAK
ncbi:MAG: ribokinase [Oscillospiraceae bacterium]|nr:ribokinase [Oscillospiraceae bacterium]